MQGTFNLPGGTTTLSVLVGGQGGAGGAGGGGGGGSFVWPGSGAASNATLLLAAGGGGGASPFSAGQDAVTSQSGEAGGSGFATAGPGGTAGAGGGGGGTDGLDGGGGGAFGRGGGGGSFNAGVNQTNLVGVGTGNGSVTIVATVAASITTTLSASTVTAGTPVTDTASISGGTPNAADAVTFSWFTNGACAAPAAATQAVSVTLSASGAGTATSGPNTPATAGAYAYQAALSGSDTGMSPCEPVTATAPAPAPMLPSSITTALSTSTPALGAVVTDTATVSGAEPLSGTVGFTLYSGATCSGTVVGAASMPVTGTTTATATWSVTPPQPGAYSILASYSGDAVNPAATAACQVFTVGSGGLSLAALRSGGLSIGVSGCGTTTPRALPGVFEFGAVSVVTALPCAGHVFLGWTGGPCAGTTTNPCAIPDATPGPITANFSP